MSMSSRRPYMLRALYEWIVDNSCTPYVLVNAKATGVEVPLEHVNKDGQIVLNISPTSVVDLDLGLESVSFSARFGGVPRDLFIPIYAVLGIYARENGQGIVFEAEPEPPTPPEPTQPEGDSDAKRPSLRVVK
ncbi:ClpXP protease specificity-enhancing factor [Gilvimarinus agarilyticus]|uniref:ClpXP protease specificity-enhancing factor n=1 Tax=unclassified Gilvimarinus TaxID=2642066 RepID=UPI001C096648|nr:MULTISPECIES: ClpXP protease specificity-enhancing factor [unclassified Gilvimarinus]MBU2887632.1 ClpXP protease specificity-enhancing factor [Gilvimarinus agarilyticus]MDO6572283.1 ClpXP protease specificity-enhancing factor [Gilvimarinus sp. 2_MG-2023]MDO6746850.1 ClpXP protease specificity-enhancing factor [Gilvimarinus sp. 1_MG-2023]